MEKKKKVMLFVIITIVVLLLVGLLLFLLLKDNNKVTVTFDSDGGTEVEPQKIKKGGTITIPESTKEGFILDGWYHDEQKITAGTFIFTDTTLKAKWVTEAPKSFTVTFDSKGGTEVEKIEVECNKELVLPTPPTKDGYNFVSWVDKNETPILDEALLACEDITLFANWEKKDDAKKYYTIKFDSQGGSNINSIQVECNTKVKLPTTKPTKTGYNFISWADKHGKVILDGALLSCEDVTLFANWEKKEENKETKYYTVTFDSQGGSKVNSIKVECDKLLTLPANPTRTGYTFVSWYDKNGKTILTGAKLSCEDITLYADWKKDEPESVKKPTCKEGVLSGDKCVVTKAAELGCDIQHEKLYNNKCYSVRTYKPTVCRVQVGMEGSGSSLRPVLKEGSLYKESNNWVCYYERDTSGSCAADHKIMGVCYKYVQRNPLSFNPCSEAGSGYEHVIGNALYGTVEKGTGAATGCYKPTEKHYICETGFTLSGTNCTKSISPTYE